MSINRALLKYGYSSFKLEILEYCDPQNVIIREQFYLDLLKPEYNILAKAGSCLGFKHSAETKQKMREAEHSGRFKKGHQHAEETKTKISEAHMGRKHTEETLVKFIGRNRPAGAGRPGQKIEVFDKETNLTTTFDSFSAAATALDIRQEAIKNYLARNLQKPYKGRYIFTKV
jgi:group I intron endonuclease